MTDPEDQDRLAERFEQDRDHLTAVAYKVLGSRTEADDAVQEAWLRLSRSDVTGVDNLTGWLTTVVSRVCLDMLRSRRSRRESVLDDQRIDDPRPDPVAPGPEEDALVVDAVGPALQLVLDSLAPAERLAFVLHDIFAVPFDEIAPIIGRTPTAARQMASRARRRVQGGDPFSDPDRARRRQIVDAFLDASRNGNFAGLLALLDPEATVRGDAFAMSMGAANADGAEAVAATFVGRAKAARTALIDDEPGAAWMYRGELNGIFGFTVVGDLITKIELILDPEALATTEVVFV